MLFRSFVHFFCLYTLYNHPSRLLVAVAAQSKRQAHRGEKGAKAMTWFLCSLSIIHVCATIRQGNRTHARWRSSSLQTPRRRHPHSNNPDFMRHGKTSTQARQGTPRSKRRAKGHASTRARKPANQPTDQTNGHRPTTKHQQARQERRGRAAARLSPSPPQAPRQARQAGRRDTKQVSKLRTPRPPRPCRPRPCRRPPPRSPSRAPPGPRAPRRTPPPPSPRPRTSARRRAWRT